MATKILEGDAFKLLDNAQLYADIHSTCTKVRVGSAIQTDDGTVIFGCNHGVYNCKLNGCRRIELYGENSKEHRLPSDCDAIHSEVDAICQAAQSGISLKNASIFVTRYPCEACARAIAASGISTVVYGRRETMSSYSQQILESAGVEAYKIRWEREDNND